MSVRLRFPALISVNVSALYPELEFAALRAGDSAANAPQYSKDPQVVGELSVAVLVTDVALEREDTVSTDVAVDVDVAVVVVVVGIATVLVTVDTAVVVIVVIELVVAAKVVLDRVEVAVLTAVTLTGVDGKIWATATPSPPARTTASSIPAKTLLWYVMRHALFLVETLL